MSVRVFTLNEENMIDTEIRDFISISVNDTYERISKTANISFAYRFNNWLTQINVGTKFAITYNSQPIFIGNLINYNYTLSSSGKILNLQLQDFYHYYLDSTVEKSFVIGEKTTQKSAIENLISQVYKPSNLIFNQSYKELTLSKISVGKKKSAKTLISISDNTNKNLTGYQPKIGDSIADNINKIVHQSNLHPQTIFENTGLQFSENLRIDNPITDNLIDYILPRAFLDYNVNVDLQNQLEIYTGLGSIGNSFNFSSSNLKVASLNEFTAFDEKGNILKPVQDFLTRNKIKHITPVCEQLFEYSDFFLPNKTNNIRISVFEKRARSETELRNLVFASTKKRQRTAISITLNLPYWALDDKILTTNKNVSLDSLDLKISDDGIYPEWFISEVDYNYSNSGLTSRLKLIPKNTMLFACEE